ncbi:MAG: von Willebrand factor type A domain-containing protein, partial [Myxococcota bacterium]|nr:von Willebrand factor type A domain-containing protein [Myxococcota bacterium]
MIQRNRRSHPTLRSRRPRPGTAARLALLALGFALLACPPKLDEPDTGEQPLMDEQPAEEPMLAGEAEMEDMAVMSPAPAGAKRKSPTRGRAEKDTDGDGGDGFDTEAYDSVAENDFLAVKGNPLSTFSIDVDTASYANVRRMLEGGSMPPAGAVRIEELVNYFSYDYAGPSDDTPFATHVEVAGCPWKTDHRLVRIGLKGQELDLSQRPPSNLVFLLDVSGSMEDPNKLPLLRRSLKMMVEHLGENDRVAIAV